MGIENINKFKPGDESYNYKTQPSGHKTFLPLKLKKSKKGKKP